MKKRSRVKTSNVNIHSVSDPDWIISELEWQALSPELIEARVDFAPPPRKNTDAMKQRQAYLLKIGFKKINNPSNAPRGSIALEKIHNNILLDRHCFDKFGNYKRSLTIQNVKLLDGLTRDIKLATKAALIENKRPENTTLDVPGTIRYRASDEEEWYGAHLEANKRLAVLMRNHRDLIRALQVRDPLSPSAPAFSLGPLQGASTTAHVRQSYFQFLAVVTRTDEIIERHKGRKSVLTYLQKQLAEPMIRAGVSDLKVADTIWPRAEEIEHLEARIKRFRGTLKIRRRS